MSDLYVAKADTHFAVVSQLDGKLYAYGYDGVTTGYHKVRELYVCKYDAGLDANVFVLVGRYKAPTATPTSAIHQNGLTQDAFGKVRFHVGSPTFPAGVTRFNVDFYLNGAWTSSGNTTSSGGDVLSGWDYDPLVPDTGKADEWFSNVQGDGPKYTTGTITSTDTNPVP